MEESISQSKTVDRLDELVRDYIDTGWARLQLGAAVSRIRQEQELKTDAAVYVYIQKTHRYGLSRLRHIKRAAEVAEIVDGEIDIYSASPEPDRLIKSDLVAMPLASHLRERENIEQNKGIVIEVLKDAKKLAEKDGRIEPNERDVKKALARSPIGSKPIKLPELVAELQSICNKLAVIHRSAKQVDFPFSEKDLLSLEKMIESMKEMIKDQEEAACLRSEQLEDAKLKISQIEASFPAYSQWACPCTKNKGLSHGLDKLLELLPAVDVGGRHSLLVGDKVLTLNSENFAKLCEELNNRVKLDIDGEGIIMPDVSQHAPIREGHEGEYEAFHDCQTLMYGGLALLLSNVCLINGYKVPELEIGHDYVARLEGTLWGVWKMDGGKCDLFVRDAEENLEPEDKEANNPSPEVLEPRISRRENRGRRETRRCSDMVAELR